MSHNTTLCHLSAECASSATYVRHRKHIHTHIYWHVHTPTPTHPQTHHHHHQHNHAQSLSSGLPSDSLRSSPMTIFKFSFESLIKTMSSVNLRLLRVFTVYPDLYVIRLYPLPDAASQTPSPYLYPCVASVPLFTSPPPPSQPLCCKCLHPRYPSAIDPRSPNNLNTG